MTVFSIDPERARPAERMDEHLGGHRHSRVIAFYLVWWLTQSLGAPLDRIIQFLEQIARTLKVGTL
jgi:hypothetical protein